MKITCSWTPDIFLFFLICSLIFLICGSLFWFISFSWNWSYFIKFAMSCDLPYKLQCTVLIFQLCLKYYLLPFPTLVGLNVWCNGWNEICIFITFIKISYFTMSTSSLGLSDSKVTVIDVSNISQFVIPNSMSSFFPYLKYFFHILVSLL